MTFAITLNGTPGDFLKNPAFTELLKHNTTRDVGPLVIRRTSAMPPRKMTETIRTEDYTIEAFDRKLTTEEAATEFAAAYRDGMPQDSAQAGEGVYQVKLEFDLSPVFPASRRMRVCIPPALMQEMLHHPDIERTRAYDIHYNDLDKPGAQDPIRELGMRIDLIEKEQAGTLDQHWDTMRRNGVMSSRSPRSGYQFTVVNRTRENGYAL